MIKKFEEYVTENINYGFGKIKFDNKESESRYKEIKKEKEKKEFEKLKKYEKYFGELDDNDVKKINKEDLKDVLNNILKYLKTFKTPLERFIKDDDKIGDEFMNMAFNIHKLYIPDSIRQNGKIIPNEIKKTDIFNDIKTFHKYIVKDFIGIEDVLESSDKEHEDVVKTFYKYLMFVDRVYNIWD